MCAPVPDVREWDSRAAGVTIDVDYEKCAGHAKCVEVCPSGVYELAGGKATCPNIDGCVQCCACVDACPTGAIRHSSCR